MQVTIAPLASPDELEAVLAIERESFTNPWTRAMHVADLENADVSHLFIARDDGGHAVGFCSFWIVLDELHVNNLAVRAAFRRCGVASRLLQHVLDEACQRGASRATLEVRRSNVAAIQLYERWGFSLSTVRLGYYTHPAEDALVLAHHDLSTARRDDSSPKRPSAST